MSERMVIKGDLQFVMDDTAAVFEGIRTICYTDSIEVKIA